MKVFWFYLKRDFFMLLPVNTIIFLLLFTGVILLKALQLRIGEPFGMQALTAAGALFFVFVFVLCLAIAVEAIWKEWRKRTQYDWYAMPGSIHTKLASKLLAVLGWQLIQIVLAFSLFLVMTLWTAGEESATRMINGLDVLPAFGWEYLWILFISPISGILIIFLLLFFLLGIPRGWKKAGIVAVYIVVVWFFYPYISIKFEANNSVPYDSNPIVMLYQTRPLQMLIDTLVALLVYVSLSVFLTRKLEL